MNIPILYVKFIKKLAGYEKILLILHKRYKYVSYTLFNERPKHTKNFESKLCNNTMSQQIRHEGKIESIYGEHIVVRITQKSACLSCKLSEKCLTSESKVKTIDVYSPVAAHYAIGDAVTVEASEKMGMTAVLLAFVVPTAVVVATIVATLLLTAHDGPCPLDETNSQIVAALGGLGALAVYYAALYAFRRKLQNVIVFSISDTGTPPQTDKNPLP